ncbi:unnamed protein product [Cladocopium goreaui]|uniref:PUB domain-containing protein n=1 Tax=Cladocopium goreaui TaxID=2562237 RepID=A0A9P1CMC8_9DINO|nr:unnamed protein product [Cladocopium goreaui]
MVMGIGVPSASPTGNAAKKDKSRRKGASDEEDDAQNEEWVEPHSECQDDSGGSDSPRGRKRRKRRERDRDRRGRRGRSRGRDRERSRTPVRLPEVDRFIDENNINSEAAMKIRALSPESQRKVIARPLTGDVQNPSKVMIARVRELQNQNEKSKTGSGADFSLWSGAMLGAPPEAAIAKYIEENDLDVLNSTQTAQPGLFELCCRTTRQLPSTGTYRPTRTVPQNSCRWPLRLEMPRLFQCQCRQCMACLQSRGLEVYRLCTQCHHLD